MDLDRLARQMGPLQERLQKAQEQRAAERIEGRAGGGAVSVVLRGDLRVEQVHIAPAAASAVGDDPGMLEDLIAAALGDALKQYAQRYGASPEEQMQKAFGDDPAAFLGPLMGGLGGLG